MVRSDLLADAAFGRAAAEMKALLASNSTPQVR